jgi:hypothetical protein
MEQHSWKKPLRDRAELQKVLSVVLDQLDADASALEYRLVGTGAALAQGVQLPTGDIDILVARRGEVDRFAAALSGFPCLVPPAWLPDARQYFARFRVEQIDVEISTVERPADTETSAWIGPWEHHVQIKLGTHIVPAICLELQLVTELVRDRPDRYTPLIQHMQVHGADLRLLLKAMREQELNPVLQEEVLGHLRDQQPAGRPPG